MPEEITVIAAINAARVMSGLAPLQVDDRLTRAARNHATDMSQHPGMYHTGSDGSDGGDRIQACGYNWSEWEEVIGWEYGEAERMVGWWLRSPDHEPRLMSQTMTHIGAGHIFRPGSMWLHYWVVSFATGDTSASTAYIPVALSGG